MQMIVSSNIASNFQNNFTYTILPMCATQCKYLFHKILNFFLEWGAKIIVKLNTSNPVRLHKLTLTMDVDCKTKIPHIWLAFLNWHKHKISITTSVVK